MTPLSQETTDMAPNDITFTKHDDIEGDDNRGWKVDKISAVDADGKEVGYLKLSYIPRQRYKSRVKTIWDFLSVYKGHSIFPYDPDNKVARDHNDLDDAELVKFANRASLMLGHGDISHELGWGGSDLRYDYSRYPEGVTRQTILDRIADLELAAMQRHMDEWDEFRRYFVDKVIDDYVSVDESRRREGIALEMYQQAAVWLRDRKLAFYLSSIRSDAAEGVKSKMREVGMIRVKNRYGRYRISTMPQAVSTYKGLDGLEALAQMSIDRGFGDMLNTGK